MPDWMSEQVENMVHVHEREEWRCAVEAAERAGEYLEDDRPSKRELDAEEFWDNWDETVAMPFETVEHNDE